MPKHWLLLIKLFFKWFIHLKELQRGSKRKRAIFHLLVPSPTWIAGPGLDQVEAISFIWIFHIGGTDRNILSCFSAAMSLEVDWKGSSEATRQYPSERLASQVAGLPVPHNAGSPPHTFWSPTALAYCAGTLFCPCYGACLISHFIIKFSLLGVFRNTIFRWCTIFLCHTLHEIITR